MLNVDSVPYSYWMPYSCLGLTLMTTSIYSSLLWWSCLTAQMSLSQSKGLCINKQKKESDIYNFLKSTSYVLNQLYSFYTVTKYIIVSCFYFRIALETVDKLTLTLDLTEFASRIIHPLVRTLDSVPELQTAAMDTLCAMVMQMGPKFTIFIPMVQRVIQKHKIAHQRYFILMARILKVSQNVIIIIAC